MATRPTGHPDRYLATGKKYVVSTSNRVVINLKCGAPTKIRQAKLVARILTHAQKEKRSSAIERGGNKRGSVWHVRKANDEAVDFQQTFHLFAYLPRLSDCRIVEMSACWLLKVGPEGPFAKYFHVAVTTT